MRWWTTAEKECLQRCINGAVVHGYWTSTLAGFAPFFPPSPSSPDVPVRVALSPAHRSEVLDKRPKGKNASDVLNLLLQLDHGAPDEAKKHGPYRARVLRALRKLIKLEAKSKKNGNVFACPPFFYPRT
jgi:hypothetical protein